MHQYAEIRKAVHEYLECILKDREYSRLDDYLSPAISGFGTADHENIISLEELKKHFRQEFMLIDQPLRYEIIYEKYQLLLPDMAVAMLKLNITVDLPEGPLRMQGFRRSLVWRREADNKWRIIHMHHSAPERELKPGESYAIEAVRERNIELQRLVAERTGELQRQANELKKARVDAEVKTRLVEKQNELLLQEIKERRLVEEKLRLSEESLRRLAQTDQLTGVHNRRSFMGNAELAFGHCDEPLAILIFDLDYFKDVNDTYGHHVGDRALHWVASMTMGMIESGEVFGRLGGEEFAVLFPGRTLNYAKSRAEHLLKVISESHCDTPRGRIRLTVSIGVTGKRVDDLTFDDLYMRADAALYKAKAKGRNSVVIMA